MALVTYHMDALQFLSEQKSEIYKGCLFDPPYSLTQAKECYDSFGKDLFVEHDCYLLWMEHKRIW